MNNLRDHLEQLAPSSELKITPHQYEDETLTEEETTEALRVAREKKSIERQKQEWFDKIKAQPVYRQYSAAELFKAVQQTRSHNGKRFILDNENEEQIRQLCLYFSNDKRFNGDLRKGLMLQGAVGTGKTHLMSFFQQNQHASFSVVQSRAIENNWISESANDERKIIDYYSANRPVAFGENGFGHTSSGWCFDDVGTETHPSKRFGEDKNVMAEVILNRYDNKIPFNTTHLTTNLTSEEIEAHYGTRVRERIREMCNVITFTGKSRR